MLLVIVLSTEFESVFGVGLREKNVGAAIICHTLYSLVPTYHRI